MRTEDAIPELRSKWKEHRDFLDLEWNKFWRNGKTDDDIFILQSTDGTFMRFRWETPKVFSVWWDNPHIPFLKVEDGDELKHYMDRLVNELWDWDRGMPMWRWRLHEDLFYDHYLAPQGDEEEEEGEEESKETEPYIPPQKGDITKMLLEAFGGN
jgi:hypothetical protein